MMIGAVMPASPPMPLNTPLVSPIQPLGDSRRNQRPVDRSEPVGKKRERQEQDDQRGMVHEIRTDDAGRQREPAYDRCLAREKLRLKLWRYNQSDSAPEQSTPAKAPTRQRGVKPSLDESGADRSRR